MELDEGFCDVAAVDTNLQPAESVLAVCSDQDLLKDIFHRLDIKDLCSSSCVCTLWNQVGCCFVCAQHAPANISTRLPQDLTWPLWL
jgi:hypothetical protein